MARAKRRRLKKAPTSSIIDLRLKGYTLKQIAKELHQSLFYVWYVCDRAGIIKEKKTKPPVYTSCRITCIMCGKFINSKNTIKKYCGIRCNSHANYTRNRDKIVLRQPEIQMRWYKKNRDSQLKYMKQYSRMCKSLRKIGRERIASKN